MDRRLFRCSLSNTVSSTLLVEHFPFRRSGTEPKVPDLLQDLSSSPPDFSAFLEPLFTTHYIIRSCKSWEKGLKMMPEMDSVFQDKNFGAYFWMPQRNLGINRLIIDRVFCSTEKTVHPFWRNPAFMRSREIESESTIIQSREYWSLRWEELLWGSLIT